VISGTADGVSERDAATIVGVRDESAGDEVTPAARKIAGRWGAGPHPHWHSGDRSGMCRAASREARSCCWQQEPPFAFDPDAAQSLPAPQQVRGDSTWP
jgi:hypothetical protein